MQAKTIKSLFVMSLVLEAFAASPLITCTSAAAQTETTLYSFTDHSDGGNPYAGLIFDASGNLYGTAQYGGTGGGVVFELTPKTGGGWTESVLHNFYLNGVDGYAPVAGLAFDSDGNLYGTTKFGGASNNGTVFQLKPSSGGWTERILHSFAGSEGQNPNAAVILDAAGNVYGTTTSGGAHNGGTVFELTHKSGFWNFGLLHSFAGNGGPFCAPLVMDTAGDLYGTTIGGGANEFGSVFELTHQPGGGWAETVLHSFNRDGVDGFYPESALVFDASGNIYGTTIFGGSGGGGGTVFELSPAAGGGWTENILYSFNTEGFGGPSNPVWGVAFDGAGNLYGTTVAGGANGAGALYKLAPAVSGTWTESLLYSFDLDSDPRSDVVLDAAGNLYGTTFEGGADSDGAVYEIAP